MTTEQAAQLKGVGRQAVLEAIWRGDLNAVRFGRHIWNVTDDDKFQAWQPAMTYAERSQRRWAKERATQQRPIVLGAAKGSKAKAKKGGK